MKIVFLGTGTSVGIPVIGCDCAVCRSSDPMNRRRRASLYVEAGGVHLVVDTSPDFREQALACGMRRVDALLYTHSHADHIFGFDDIRRFNTIQGCIIPAYGSHGTVDDLKRVFNYVRTEKEPGVYRPLTEFRIMPALLRIGELEIEPLPVEHGNKETVGFLFRAESRAFAYVPDCHTMPDATLARLAGLDLMVLDALRPTPHKTHLTLDDSTALLRKIGAGLSYITHMCHDIDHAATEAAMPQGMHVAYDGLEIELGKDSEGETLNPEP